MKANSFKELYERAEERDSYKSASIILEFTEGLYRMMEEKNISRKDLAERLGTSPAYVTKVLRGNVNFTVDSMVRLARAVGGSIQIHLLPSRGDYPQPYAKKPLVAAPIVSHRFAKLGRRVGRSAGEACENKGVPEQKRSTSLER